MCVIMSTVVDLDWYVAFFNKLQDLFNKLPSF
jgi:hypothetical protein